MELIKTQDRNNVNLYLDLSENYLVKGLRIRLKRIHQLVG